MRQEASVVAEVADSNLTRVEPKDGSSIVDVFGQEAELRSILLEETRLKSAILNRADVDAKIPVRNNLESSFVVDDSDKKREKARFNSPRK